MEGRLPGQQPPRAGAGGSTPRAGAGATVPGTQYQSQYPLQQRHPQSQQHYQAQPPLPPSYANPNAPASGGSSGGGGGIAGTGVAGHDMMQQQQQEQQQPHPPERQTAARVKRKTSKAACERCRRLKRKCNANRPCEACVEQGQECVFTSDPHVSRSVAKRQRLEVLEQEIVEMRRTLDQLRHRPEPEAMDMLRRLRHQPDAKYSNFPRTRSPLRIDLAMRFPNVYSLTLPQWVADAMTIATPPSTATAVDAPQRTLSMQTPAATASAAASKRNEDARQEEQGDQPHRQQSPSQTARATDPFATSAPSSSRRISQSDPDSPRSSASAISSPVDDHGFPLLRAGPSPQNTRKVNYNAYIDPRLTTARAAPWTTIITDDHLFRILLSLYLAWYHPAFPMFDHDLFMRDLIEGRGEFCSQHLVHAILIMPCQYYPKARHLSERFLAHAEQLHHVEEGEQKLTTVQAISITGTALQILGRDKIGFLRQASALRIASDIGLLSRAKSRSHQFTIWGLYFMINLSAICLRKPSFFRSPPAVPLPDLTGGDGASSMTPRPTATVTTTSSSSSVAEPRSATSASDTTAAFAAALAKEEAEGGRARGGGSSSTRRQPPVSQQQEQSWSPYPYAGARPATYVSTFHASCRFWVIAGEISMPYERDRKWLSLDEAGSVYARMLEWSESCSGEVQPTTTSTPDVLLLHMWFHISVIELFRPFRDRGFARVQSLANSDSRVEPISAESLAQLKALIMVYASQYDCRLAHGSFLQALLVCSFELIRDLDTDAESCRFFLLCYRLLTDLSLIIPVVAPVLRVIEEAARAANASMHPEVLRLFEQGRKRLQELMHQQRFQAAYAIDLDIVGNSVEAARMDNLIEKWDAVM